MPWTAEGRARALLRENYRQYLKCMTRAHEEREDIVSPGPYLKMADECRMLTRSLTFVITGRITPNFVFIRRQKAAAA